MSLNLNGYFFLIKCSPKGVTCFAEAMEGRGVTSNLGAWGKQHKIYHFFCSPLPPPNSPFSLPVLQTYILSSRNS